MSSPSHPTSNIEDVFSSNFPDYIPASPDYVPASPGKTYSSSSNNSFGLVPIASPTLLLFHDDPYMKVTHAFYGIESTIPPPNYCCLHLRAIWNGYSKRKPKNDQTKHGMEKTKSNRSQSQSKSKSQPHENNTT
ncbi:hypothetical protein Tco_0944044 [Tanacetum coccineum]